MSFQRRVDQARADQVRKLAVGDAEAAIQLVPNSSSQEPNGSCQAAAPKTVKHASSAGPAARHEAAEKQKTPVAAPSVRAKPAIAHPPTDEYLLKQRIDVYAKSFIPAKFKKVNELPAGLVYATAPLKQLHYDQYAREAFAASLLPPMPVVDSITARELPTAMVAPVSFEPANYQRYFLHHLGEEILSQRKDYESQSLYWHDAVVEFGHDQYGQHGADLSFVVPGLLENSPLVEEDDEIHLRQLRQGDDGAPPPEQWDFRSGTWVTPWTYCAYLARVKAVVRARETLIVRVTGLTPDTSEVKLNPSSPILHQHRLRFNVQFLLNNARITPQEMALSRVQASLQLAIEATYLGAPANNSLYWFQSMLFPTTADSEIQANLNSGILAQSFYDASLNLEQRVAVENICDQKYGVMPYLISGPPGTGKTKTMIEIALQLINHVPDVSHILMCAPSDQAADTLADRLRTCCKIDEVLRLNRPSRSFAEVPESLLPYCFISADRFVLPPFEMLMKYKIVVTSCRDASILVNARMTNEDLYSVEQALHRQIHPTDLNPPRQPVRLHWDALLIDEAAQATEPEALVPLCVVAPPAEAPSLVFTPQVVMAGDEFQLNPRTSRGFTPLRLSLFARLFSRPVYANHPLARAFKYTAAQKKARILSYTNIVPPTVVPESMMLPILRPAFSNLIRNYRSHPAILAVPSSLWYHDTLEADAPKRSTDRLLQWEGWRGRRWPVLFHDNDSADDLELEGGGWFNPGETELACNYAQELAASGLVQQRDICIMSPFSAQVRKIRQAMRSRKMWEVNVGPTEAYQGLEHGVVILCTTRSRKRFVADDQERGWGLLGMPNATNVALTRAKFGLIILGKRELLVEDDVWKEVIDFCDRNGLVADVNGLPTSWHSDTYVDEEMRTRLELNMVQKDRLRGR